MASTLGIHRLINCPPKNNEATQFDYSGAEALGGCGWSGRSGQVSRSTLVLSPVIPRVPLSIDLLPSISVSPRLIHALVASIIMSLIYH